MQCQHTDTTVVILLYNTPFLRITQFTTKPHLKMAHKSLVPKQRILTENETQTGFDGWRESMDFHISLNDKSTRFLSTGDLSTWSIAADRGFADDGDVGTGVGTVITADNKMNKQAKVALLNIILGSIATYCPVISSKFIKKQSTSLESIWNRLRAFYGFRRAGSRILELSEVKLELNESRESLWERLYSFIEDQLLTKEGEVRHENIKRDADEEFTPTLLNILVTMWLQAINPSLPSLIKQRFSTQLRAATVYSLRDDHFLSTCPFLSPEDKKYISKTREIRLPDEIYDDEGEEQFHNPEQLNLTFYRSPEC